MPSLCQFTQLNFPLLIVQLDDGLSFVDGTDNSKVLVTVATYKLEYGLTIQRVQPPNIGTLLQAEELFIDQPIAGIYALTCNFSLPDLSQRPECQSFCACLLYNLPGAVGVLCGRLSLLYRF